MLWNAFVSFLISAQYLSSVNLAFHSSPVSKKVAQDKKEESPEPSSSKSVKNVTDKSPRKSSPASTPAETQEKTSKSPLSTYERKTGE